MTVGVVTGASRKPYGSSRVLRAVDRHFLHRGEGPEFEMEARWIRSQLPAHGGRVADVGCGGGALFPWIKSDTVVGFDVAVDGLRYTRRRFETVPLVAASAERLPTAPASFDAIVMQHVIEHLPDVERAVWGWFRVLRPGGRLLLVTPNAKFTDPSVYDDPTHVHIYTSGELRSLVQRCGFEVCDLRTLGVPFFRRYRRLPAGWRLRRAVLRAARALSYVPGLGQAGQSLCCSVRKVVP